MKTLSADRLLGQISGQLADAARERAERQKDSAAQFETNMLAAHEARKIEALQGRIVAAAQVGAKYVGIAASELGDPNDSQDAKRELDVLLDDQDKRPAPVGELTEFVGDMSKLPSNICDDVEIFDDAANVRIGMAGSIVDAIASGAISPGPITRAEATIRNRTAQLYRALLEQQLRDVPRG